MAKRPLVSILIPAYNAERWIRQTLKSALDQDYPNKEIVLVNDGSTDATAEIARAFKSPLLRVIDQANRGAAAARNTALTQAQGDYIQWLDQDDLLARSKVTAQLERAERVGNDRVLFSCQFGMFYHRTNRARLYSTLLYRDLRPLDYFLIKFGQHTFLQTSCWLVSRALTDAVGPWWEVRSPDDDGEYFCRVVAASESIHFVPGPWCYWRRHPMSLSADWKRSPAARESLFLSTRRCVEHFRSLEDSERSRAACLTFLQDRLIYFYPDSPHIVSRMQAIAAELGGSLQTPSLDAKYRWMALLFGWRRARRAALVCPELKASAERAWDRVMFNLSGDSC